MGKSPGKWIKTVLFGNRTSRSNLSKRTLVKSASGKTTLVSLKQQTSDLAVSPPPITEPVPGTGAQTPENLEKGGTTELSDHGANVSTHRRGGDVQTTSNLDLQIDTERIKLEQAAIKAQAAFRGYKERQAFRALKGILWLQAHIRGHLVRRQAVATLFCVQRIVKLQALFRGQKVRSSNLGIKVSEWHSVGRQDAKYMDSCKLDASNQAEKLMRNAFVRKLLSLASAPMPLHIQYGPGEPNSALEWLLRWTISQVWGPSHSSKKINVAKNVKMQYSEAEASRPRRSVKQMAPSNVENGSNNSTSDSGKRKRIQRKVTNHPTKLASDNHQNDIEKVKHNLKRIHSPSTDTSAQKKFDTNKLRQIHKMPSNSAAPDISDKPINVPAKQLKDPELDVSKPSGLEEDQKLPADKLVEELHDHSAVDLQTNHSNGGNECITETTGDFGSKNDKISNETQRTSKRRASLPAKDDHVDNELHNTPGLPSYMAATESAKAKLKAHLSSRFAQEGIEKNGLTRRHSLPSSTNGKLSSSPRVQRLASGKGGTKNEKSLLSSTDANDKVVRAEWRR